MEKSSVKQEGLRDRIAHILSNERLIQLISIMSAFAGVAMMFDSAYHVLMDDNSGTTGMIHIIMNIYAM